MTEQTRSALKAIARDLRGIAEGCRLIKIGYIGALLDVIANQLDNLADTT